MNTDFASPLNLREEIKLKPGFNVVPSLAKTVGSMVSHGVTITSGCTKTNQLESHQRVRTTGLEKKRKVLSDKSHMFVIMITN